MQIKLVDHNVGGTQTVFDALSICRNKQCNIITLNNCLTAKPIPHLSALEFSWFCFLVSGMSVKARIQLLRHRHFSTMERSTRAIDMTDAEVVVPTTAKQKRGLELSANRALINYGDLVGYGETIEDASYLLPMAAPTTFYIAGNGRVWYEYLQKRLCQKHVQAEHNIFAVNIYNKLVKVMPGFKYAHPCGECDGCKERGESID